ncbi:hypothetical protein [Haladaptatus sp. CMAA 1911]
MCWRDDAAILGRVASLKSREVFVNVSERTARQGFALTMDD